MADQVAHGGHDDEDLRGTFAVVLIIAAIIVVVWLAVFLLFLTRL
jgi:hypothetical protein